MQAKVFTVLSYAAEVALFFAAAAVVAVGMLNLR
jgi:hypothetical protein